MRAGGAIAPLAAWAMCIGCQQAAAPAPAPIALTMTARVSIYNHTREMHRLEVLPLRQDLEVDCDRLERTPADVLGRDAFVRSDSPPTIELFPGQEVTANPEAWELVGFIGRPCGAALVRGEELPDVVVWWGRSDIARNVTVDLDAPEGLLPGGLSVVLEAEYPEEEPRAWREVVCVEHAWPTRCDEDAKDEAARRPAGASYSWSGTQSPRHVVLDEVDDGGCEPTASSSLTWDIVQGTFVLEGLDVDAGGCATLTLNQSGQLLRVDVCAPDGVFDGLTPEQGSSSLVTLAYQNNAALGGELFEVTFQGFGEDEPLTRILLARLAGTQIARTGMRWSASEVDVCGVRRGECGQSAEPVTLDLDWGGLSRRLRGGEDARVGGRQVWVTRAERGLARSTVCDPWRRLTFAGGQTLHVELVAREDQ